MSIEYRCPGGASYRHGLTEQTVHGSCCAQFALMSSERRQKIGLRYPAPPEPLLAVVDEEPDPVTVGELIEAVRLLQLAEDDGVPAPVSHVQHVHVEHDFPQDQLDALLELGAEYGLRVTVTRLKP